MILFRTFNQIFASVFLLVAISLYTHIVNAQTYKCGVTVSNYLTDENTSNNIKGICSDKNGNIYYIKNSAIYKNQVEWVNYKSQYTRYFSFPFAITSDPDGNVYVFDLSKYALYKITPAAVVSLVAGVEGTSGSKDTIATKATFSSSVTSICADHRGNIFVADGSKIRKVGSGKVTTFAGQATAGNSNGQGAQASFDWLNGIACDNDNNLYTIESSINVIRKVTPDSIVSNFAGGGLYNYIDDRGTKAGFTYMKGITFGYDNHIYVSENNDGRVRRITLDGMVETVAGYKNSYEGAKYNSAVGVSYLVGVVNPTAIAQTPDGAVYVLAQYYGSYTTQQYQVVRKIVTDETCESEKHIVSTFCGDGYAMYTTAGNGRASEFKRVNDIVRDKDGNLYIAEQGTRNILKVKPNGDLSVFYTFVSNSSEPVRALAIDAAGKIYASFGGTISVVNSDGSFDKSFFEKYYDEFSATAMVFDQAGDLIFTDMYYDNIRKMDVTTGAYSTIAGGTNTAYTHIQQGYVDGAALTARFYSPIGIDIDSDGNMFIADWGNNVIRKLSKAGIVSTIAGGTYGSADGKGKLAQFGGVRGLKLDKGGSIYICDDEFNLIKKVTFPDTNVVTIAGNVYPNDESSPRYIDGKASISRFNYPKAIVMGDNNDLYVADYFNSAIRRVTIDNTPITTSVAPDVILNEASFHLRPNPASHTITFDQERVFKIYDLNDKLCMSGKGIEVDIAELAEGMYFVSFTEIGKTEKLIKK